MALSPNPGSPQSSSAWAAPQGWTALHAAAYYGHTDAVAVLAAAFPEAAAVKAINGAGPQLGADAGPWRAQVANDSKK